MSAADPLLAVAGFITVAAITPGPNNFIVMAAAARGGFGAALPAIAGVVIGSLGLLALVWAGAGAAFAALPPLRLLLKMAGAGYLIWLGSLLIGQSGRQDNGEASSKDRLPTTAHGVAAFQLMNPKAWVLIVTASAALPGQSTAPYALAGLLAVVSVLCLSLWACAGSAITGWLQIPSARSWFDRAMGSLLIVSAALLLL